MQLVKLILMVLSFIVANTLAETDKTEMNVWAAKTLSSLTSGCDRLDRKKWAARYEDLSEEVMNKLESVDEDKFESYEATAPLREVVSNVFSQHVPGKLPSNPCFADFQDFLKAKNKSGGAEAMKQFKACNGSWFKGKVPEVVTEVLDCMKKVKN